MMDALPEKLSLKINIMGQLPEQSPKDCNLAADLSSYKSSLMLNNVDPDDPKRICNNAVELMTCGHTNDIIMSFLKERLEDVGMHTTIARKEVAGFILTRLWAAIKMEGLLTDEGV